jgi:hypothetical protein
VLFQAHSATLGLQFYNGQLFLKNIAMALLLRFVVLGIAIAALVTKLFLFPLILKGDRKDTMKTS